MKKIQILRKKFEKYKIDGYIIPKNDEYFNEYISSSEDRLKFLSNFSGSAGFAIILKNKNDDKILSAAGYSKLNKLICEQSDENVDLVLVSMGGNDVFQLTPPWIWKKNIYKCVKLIFQKNEKRSHRIIR